jgi:hypothetical protein
MYQYNLRFPYIFFHRNRANIIIHSVFQDGSIRMFAKTRQNIDLYTTASFTDLYKGSKIVVFKSILTTF